MANKPEKKMAFEVTLEVTNSSKNHAKRRDKEDDDAFSDVTYFDCEDGKIVVHTNDPEDIYRTFGRFTVKEIKRIGIGYVL